jgi:hypothetical protein
MMDPQGGHGGPGILLLSLRSPDFRGVEKAKKSWLTSECRLFRSAAPGIAAKTSQEINGAMLV